MKQYLILLFVVIIMTLSCNNAGTDYSKNPTKDPANIAKAQQLINNRMAAFLGSRDSGYQSIAFTGLDSAFDNLAEGADPNATHPHEFAGFKMTHDFRALDAFNQLSNHRYTYFFNSPITEIIAVRDSIQ